MIKKIVALLCVLFLISGCAETIKNGFVKEESISEPVKEVLQTIDIDFGSSPNIVSDNSHIYIIYVKEKDIYAKKYYLDFTSIKGGTFDNRTFESQPTRVTRSENIEKVGLSDFNNYIFRLNYLTTDGKYYYAESYRDFGLMNKKEKDSIDIKLLDTLTISNKTYKVSEKDGKIIAEESSK
ncbi:MAG: hypothetical protein WC413_02195 [Candidatus Nanoarchaeia archaeon]